MPDKYGNLYGYNASVPAAALFAGLFGLSTAYHAFQLLRWRTWYFIPFVIGGFCETVGYVSRAVSIGSDDAANTHRDPFIIQTVLILVAPALYAASIYMIFGRLIRLVEGEAYAIIKPRWITVIFVMGDVLSFLTQGGGGGILATAKFDQKKAKLGEKLIIVGLFIQIIVFGFFVVLVALFHRRIVRRPTTKSTTVTVPWRRFIWILYIASGLILVRSIFRTVEYIDGRGGYIQRYEVFFYVLDTVLMFFVSITFNVYHPSSIISHRVADGLLLDSIDRESSSRGIVDRSSNKNMA